MTKIIAKLYDEAIVLNGNSNYMAGELDAEKFAELIVRECIRYFNEDYNRNFAILWREDLSIGVKQYFGVKE